MKCLAASEEALCSKKSCAPACRTVSGRPLNGAVMRLSGRYLDVLTS
jgi:hypothetical protein